MESRISGGSKNSRLEVVISTNEVVRCSSQRSDSDDRPTYSVFTIGQQKRYKTNNFRSVSRTNGGSPPLTCTNTYGPPPVVLLMGSQTDCAIQYRTIEMEILDRVQTSGDHDGGTLLFHFNFRTFTNTEDDNMIYNTFCV